jgi:glycosyltransferase involved in cell wall biosynthesis
MNLNYVLITAARNEETYLEKTIRSVASQTVPPKKWIVVSDGSTDRTKEILKDYASRIPFMELICLPEHSERHFAAKVRAFNKGYEKLKGLSYDIIGNLDADISFVPDFFEFLLGKFEETPKLGVAGTDYIEGGFHSFRDSYISKSHVNGQCQMFRKQCFLDIGGYTPIKEGGIDWVAVTTARMKGWKTQSFQDRTYVHHHQMGRTYGNVFAARLHYGKKDYLCGGHPLWQLFRGLFQMTKKPYVVGGLLLLTGYLCCCLKRVKRPVSQELIQFHRREQMNRLKDLLRRGLSARCLSLMVQE